MDPFTIMLLVSAAATLGDAYASSQSQSAEADYTRQQMGFNAAMAGLQADDAMRRGEQDVGLIRRRARQIGGAQRAGLAAQGLDVNSGSAADLLEETQSMSEQDVLTARNNAWREAFGYKAQASDMRFQGEFAYRAGKTKARNTMLIGGLEAAGNAGMGYYRYNKS